MSGGRVILAVRGIQDEYLTGSPDVTYFLKRFSRHTKFALCTLDNVFDDSVVDFGSIVTCTVPMDKGDLIRNMYVRLTLSDLSTADTHGTGYTDSITHAMIEYAELLIGGQCIERITGEYLETHTDMFIGESNQNGIRMTEGVTRSKFGLGPASTTVRTDEFGVYPRTFLVSLPFYFTKDPGLAIPMTAITRQQIQVRIKLRKLSEVIVAPSATTSNVVQYNPGSQAYIALTTVNPGIYKGMDVDGTSITGTCKVLDVKGTEVLLSSPQTIASGETLTFSFPGSSTLLEDTQGHIRMATLPIEFVYITDDERRIFKDVQLNYVISQLQLNTREIPPSITEYTFDVDFLNPVKELFFIIQNRDFVESNVYTGNDWYNYRNPEDVVAPNNEQLQDLDFEVNGKKMIFNEVADAQFLGIIQPMNHHTRVPRRAMYNYSFALRPELSNPTGTVNMSRIINKLFRINTTINTKQRDIRVYARSYNVLRIQDGLAGVIFNSNQ